jgi:hypothetical protein
MKSKMNKPIWIIIDNGDVFEGHQAHWADCFFSNATQSNIAYALETDPMFKDCEVEIREFSDEDLVKYPEAVEFEKYLLKEYGEV